MKKLLLAAAMTAASVGAYAASPLEFRVDLNIAGLNGTAPFGLQFDLSDSLESFETTTVTVSDFQINGSGFLGSSASLNPDSLVAGEIGGSFVLTGNGTVSLSDIYRDFGSDVSSISFLVSASSTRSQNAAHHLGIFAYDGWDFLGTDAPFGTNALVSLNLSAESLFSDINVYSGSGITAGVSAIPEPSTYGLMGAGVMAGIAVIRRRKKAAGNTV